MNILILSAGTRNLLVKYFLESGFEKVVAVDASPLAPALYVASKHYIIPRMTEPNYINEIESICVDEEIDVILPLQEDELEKISEKTQWFNERGIKIVVSDSDAVKLCRDKYSFYLFLRRNNLPALKTYFEVGTFEEALRNKEIDFPVFMKPRYGCGSADSFVVNNIDFLRAVLKNYEEEFIIQEFNKGKEYGADIYCDMISGEITHIFIKEKLRMRAGETEKSISVINEGICRLIREALSHLKCRGPIDMDLFEMDGNYYISEINPRFGGGYPHAYLCGINFPKNIYNNVCGNQNRIMAKGYKSGVVALKIQEILGYNSGDLKS